MTRESEVCPECGSAKITRNTTRGLKGDTSRYRCKPEGHAFDEPDVAEVRERGPTHGLARRLLGAADD